MFGDGDDYDYDDDEGDGDDSDGIILKWKHFIFGCVTYKLLPSLLAGRV